MTENEAKTNLELVTNKWESAEEMFSDSMDIIIDQEFVDTLYIAIKAIGELPQYRAIGTVEELETASKYLRLVKKHGTVGKAIEACAEYEGIGTVEECREAMEKQRRKLVKNPYGTSYIWKAGYCPVCGCGVTARWDYCQCCGQKLNWRMHEKAH